MVLPRSQTLVMWGKAARALPPALHVFRGAPGTESQVPPRPITLNPGNGPNTLSRSSEPEQTLSLLPFERPKTLTRSPEQEQIPALDFFGSSGATRLRTLPRLCDHEKMSIAGVAMGTRDHVALGCVFCEVVRILTVETGETVATAQVRKFWPGAMCAGQEGHVYVAHAEAPSPVLRLNCCKPEVSISPTTQVLPGRVQSLCFVADCKLLVFATANNPGVVRAVSCATEETAWEARIQDGGATCESRGTPRGLAYSATLYALFVVVGPSTKVLVLNPGDGSLRQTLDLPGEVGRVLEMFCVDEMLVLHSVRQSRHEMLFFQVHLC